MSHPTNTLAILDLANPNMVNKSRLADTKLVSSQADVDKTVRDTENLIRQLEKSCRNIGSGGVSPEAEYSASDGSMSDRDGGILPKTGYDDSSSDSSSSSHHSRHSRHSQRLPRQDYGVTLDDIDSYRHHDHHHSNPRDRIDAFNRSCDTVPDPRLNDTTEVHRAASKREIVCRGQQLYDSLKAQDVNLDAVKYPHSSLSYEENYQILEILEYRNDVIGGRDFITESIQCVANFAARTCDGSFSILGIPIDLTGIDTKIEAKLKRMEYATSEAGAQFFSALKVKGFFRILVELVPAVGGQLMSNNRNRAEGNIN
ncbi:hypothetical protein KDA11_06695, partial [Candidatus Saccharibacteria bacterium]|nr:hypothetical protein [Candidatus Saccharibacteria bacterium]